MFSRKKKKKRKEKKEKEPKKGREPFVSESIKRSVVGIGLLLVALVIVLGFYNIAGKGGEWADNTLTSLFGGVKVFVPFLFFLSALVYFKTV